MSEVSETFFTVIGCMDGRCQQAVAVFGKKEFGAQYPDTITDAGMVKILAAPISQEYKNDLEKKLHISLEKHHTKGIVVFGHQDCAANPVDENQHKKDILDSVNSIKRLVENKVPVIGVYITKTDITWIAEKVLS